MKKKFLALVAAGAILFGSIHVIFDGKSDIEAFPPQVVEMVANDNDGYIHPDEATALIKKVDDMIKQIQVDCDDIDVQSLEQYKSLRSMLSYTRSESGVLERAIAVNQDKKRAIELAAKSLADRMIELCQ